MSDLRSRVAYLQGLAAGLDIGEGSKEGRVLRKVIAVLDDIANEVEEVRELQEDLVTYVEDVDTDLSSVEDDLYGDQDEDDDLYEIGCPQCGHTIAIEAGEPLGGETFGAVCPSCGFLFYDRDDEYHPAVEEEPLQDNPS